MKKNILIVDDDDGILDALEVMLDLNGYNVETSSTGNRLKSLKKEGSPDLILLDVLLSGTDGRDLCKMVKASDETKHIPVIMLSAAPDIESSIANCFADAFMPKPFEMNELLDLIKHYLK